MADEIPGKVFMEDGMPLLELDAVQVRAELTDVDEVAIIMRWGREGEDLILYLDRVHAIALAGEIAKAATTPQTELPKGHVDAL